MTAIVILIGHDHQVPVTETLGVHVLMVELETHDLDQILRMGKGRVGDMSGVEEGNYVNQSRVVISGLHGQSSSSL